MIFWDLVERHLDEAEFLWERWEHSLLAPDYTLEEVAAESEERLLAHVDGLVANGPEVARRLLYPALEKGEPHRVSAAALALLRSPGEAGLEAVVKALRGRRLGQREAVTRALACADQAAPLERMRGLLGDPDPHVVAAAAEVLFFHRASVGAVLPSLWGSGEPAMQALALKALPEEPDALRHLTLLKAGLREEAPHVAAAAMEVGCRLGLSEAWHRVRVCAAGANKQAMLLLALGGGRGEQEVLLNALADPERRPAALWALGFVGTPEAVDASLELLQDPQVCHLAGEVFTAVTGVDLNDAGLIVSPPEDEALVHTAEDDLPRPDAAKVRQWWVEHRGAFLPGHRYLMGKPRSLERLLEALLGGPMRRRPALALDLQLRASTTPGPRLQVLAPTRQQYAELKTLHALVGTNLDLERSLL